MKRAPFGPAAWVPFAPLVLGAITASLVLGLLVHDVSTSETLAGVQGLLVRAGRLQRLAGQSTATGDARARERFLAECGEVLVRLAAIEVTGEASRVAETRRDAEQARDHAAAMWGAPGLQDTPGRAEEIILLQTLTRIADNIEALHGTVSANSARTSIFGLLAVLLANILTGVALTLAAIRKGTGGQGVHVAPAELFRRMAAGETVSEPSGPDAELLSAIRSFVAHQKNEASRLAEELAENRRLNESTRAAHMHLSDALTRLRRAQDELIRQQRVGALEQVARGVAHDFNSLLTPILMTADYMLKCPANFTNPETLAQQIKTVHDAALAAKALVRRLGEYFTPARPELAPIIDVNDVVQKTVDTVSPDLALSKPGVHGIIRVTVAPGSLPPMRASSTDIRDALVALLNNAAEAMLDGGSIGVTTSHRRNEVTIEVRDTGRGMTAEQVERSCEPFYSTKGAGHPGMGLTGVVAMARNYGGTVDVFSMPGEGATVTIRLPVRATDAAGVLAPSEPGTAPAPSFKILIVDDELWCREVLARGLEMEGHRPDTAGTGEQCLTMAQARHYDVIILDMALPGISGADAARQLRRSGSTTPVVMLTGLGELMLRDDERPEGVSMVMPKPVTIDDLNAAICHLCRPQGPNETGKS